MVRQWRQWWMQYGVQFPLADVVALISASLVLIIFLLNAQADFTAGNYMMIPIYSVAGIFFALWAFRNPEYSRALSFAGLFAGIVGLTYYGEAFATICDQDGTLGSAFSLAFAGTVGMILQVFIPRSHQTQSREEFTFVAAAGTQSSTFRRLDGATILLYVILFTAALVAILPFFWMISTSLMTLGETVLRQWLPANPQVCNYFEAWKEAQFSRYFFNSVAISVTTISGMVTTSVLAGYAFAKINFYGRDRLFSLLLITLMIPESVTMIPNFLIISGQVFPLPQIGADGYLLSFGGSWINTLPALTVPFMASAFSIFMLRQFFVQVPNELWEAARIDGSGHLRFLIQVVIPISRAPILTVMLLSFIGAWNNFLWPLIVTTNEVWRPLMVGLYNFTQEAGTETHLLMAGSFITILPMLILYFMTQRTFTEGIATSGLKG